MTVRHLLICAGGTGGHVYPGLAVASAWRAAGHRVSWMGGLRGLENRVVPEAQIELSAIPVQGLRGKGLLGWLMAPLRLLRALGFALRAVRRLHPDVVLGMGGFAAGPGGFAAWLLQIPLVIHEQNARAGWTNRVLQHIAKTSLQAFPGALKDAESVGNPVRDCIVNLAPPEQRYAERNGALRLLVLGGSLGALRLNQLVLEMLRAMPEAQRPQVWQQAGPAHFEMISEAYVDAGIDILTDDDSSVSNGSIRVQPYIEDMASAYAWADVVLARAGAMTVSELAAAGVAAWLVPFPHAVDDHQAANASFLVAAGAAQMWRQEQLTAADLLHAMQQATRSQLLEQAKAARSLAQTAATTRITDVCLRWAA
ncbi:MAG: undecaprenyldiphospho-muramoylpentapeptide beta-N-acetylglucosaminyltransferase [Gammaproteobacteria bacterium]